MGNDSVTLVAVEGSTLAVTHIFDGQEVVTGGDDGQAWVATFASAREAKRYVESMRGYKTVWAERVNSDDQRERQHSKPKPA